MKIYDVTVIGAGAAGTMAAIRARELGKKVALIERNDYLGREVLITGKGRCNVTNSAPIDRFIEEFGESGQFLRTAFHKFSNEDLMDFFKESGLELKIERQGRVFPVTDNAMSIVEVMKKRLSDNGVEQLYNTRVTGIRIESGDFVLDVEDAGSIRSKKVVLATGGASYKTTGSTGEGFKMAEKLGHTITQLEPGLVPLKTKEIWVGEVQGLTLKNIRLTFSFGKKKIVSELGQILFTHFGVSGPLILDLSAKVVKGLAEYKNIKLCIDLKPALGHSELEDRILRDIKTQGNKELKNFLKSFLPASIIGIFLKISSVDPEKKANQLTGPERKRMVCVFKALPLTITGALHLEEAMVTSGGVSTRQINPRTMESRIVRGLYFEGEIIEGAASSGGYNLQQAFSTGYLSGESAALCEI
jgi:predicted Rossmann fold flavoprotein